MDYSNDNADNTFAGSASSTGLCWTWASLSTADGEQRNDSSRNGMDDSLITELAKLIHKTSSETAITLNEHVRRVDSLLHIVAEKPELCQLQDYHGLLPLHVAVENNVPLELIRLLVQAHPAGTVVKYVNEIGITTVLRRATTVTMFDYLLDETMRYLSWTREQSGWSAIQIFFQYHYDMDAVVQRLVDELPGFLKERYMYLTAECFSRGFFSQLPLHLAVEMNAPINVLMMLVLRYEKALSEKTHEGNTPLNLACCVGHVEPPMIRLLATSASVRAFNGVGKLPLHNYCDRSRQDYVLDSQVIEMLVNLFPNSVRTTAPSGQTALHLACKGANADDIEAIRLLVQFCPQTLHMTDCQDYTPLRCLCLLAGGEQSLPVTPSFRHGGFAKMRGTT